MRFISAFTAWLLLLCPFALSQASTPLISPEVHSDGSVTFRFLDPQSPEVQLQMDGAKPVMMQKDDHGVWSSTTAPLAPDYYGYHFQIGRVGVIDPSNPALLPNLLQNESVVHVPGPTSLPWELRDEPHGVLHHQFYKSSIVGDQRDFYVYTPPGYDPRSETEYPVLYLLHGYGQLTSSWTQTGLANVIFDHLIDEGKAKPMIVVIPLANGGEEIIAGGHEAFMNDALRMKNFDRFTGDLFAEVIPRVERDYRVKRDRNARAIAGLSMGGAESLHTGLNHLDEFAWIGAFSSGGMLRNFDEEFPSLGTSTNAKLHLLWIGCGVDDVWTTLNRDFNKWLDAKEVKHTYVETAGQHTWMVWRRNLANFAPLLFH
jgi:enterochelin esterase-like enzyme